MLRNLISGFLLMLSITCFGDNAADNSDIQNTEINADTMISIDPNASIDTQTGKKLYDAECMACHGADGNAAVPAFPKLAGQQDNYVRKELSDYQKGAQGGRNNPIMTPIAQKLSDKDIANLLAYIDGFKANNGGADPKLKARGETLYRAGDKKLAIPACSACHGPTSAGNSDARFPSLAGQNSAYIIQQLQAFSSGQRGNDPQKMMQTIASRLSSSDQQAVASFINGLRPGSE